MKFKVEIFSISEWKDLEDGRIVFRRNGFGAVICLMERPYVEVNIAPQLSKYDIISKIPFAIHKMEEEIKKCEEYPRICFYD